MNAEELKGHAREARKILLRMIYGAGDGHLGCGLSSIDILTALYNGVIDINRDRFILSKGHAVAAWYAVLIVKGLLPESIIDQYCRNGSHVASHASREVAPHLLAVSSGSGGHGLPVANGFALANRYDETPGRIFVLAGDGELAEGSMWEGIEFAGHHILSDVRLIIDANGLQSEGRTKDILNLEPMGQKFRAFRWTANSIDGHNMGSLVECMSQKTSQPYALVAYTTKGKGAKSMENDYIWHHSPPTEAQYNVAMKEIEES